jgi:parallel beta-helix repeat protein
MNQGYPVKYAFDQAGADYPTCASHGCMRFAGDTEFAVVPIVSRISIECGDTITQDVILNHDLSDCSGNGIILGADGITLEGNNHIIDGTGSGDGIQVNNHHDLTIKNCVIREFNSGIDLSFSSNDTLMNNVVYNNDSTGIRLLSSTDNVFINNIVCSNGLNGINLSDTSRFNLLWNNWFINNFVNNAYEDSASTDNSWNLSDTGNFWSDCETNPGYPDSYEIPGSGNGVDFYPQCIYPPGSFSLISPQDSALVPPDITFDWEDAEDPEDDTVWYDLHVSTSSDFHPDSTVVFNSLLNSNYLDTLEIGGYYWKVRAYDKWGMETWSTQNWSFKVTNNPPGSFSLLLPEDSAFVPPEVILDWEDAEDPDPWDVAVWYDLYISTSSDFNPDSTVIHNNLLNSNYSDTIDIEVFYWKTRAYDRWGAETWSTQTWSFSVFLCGDANGDGETTIADVVYIVNYVFKSGPAPEPIRSADVNCDDIVDIIDAVYLVNYLFKNGPPPGDPDDDGIPDC